jgi:hypothetical protein
MERDFDSLALPAFVLGRRLDVLASNRLARALLTDFDALPVADRNFARFMLLDPAGTGPVPGLGADRGRDRGDPAA